MRFRILLLIALCLISLDAQAQATQVFIVAPKTSFVWGDPNTLNVIVRDSNGNRLSSRTIAWFIEPAGAASIAADGSITPNRLQAFTARATDVNSGASAEIVLQTLPKKIVVIPERQSMAVGASQMLRAEALDINDRPIPGVTFTWRLTNLAGYWDSNYPMARIDAAGRLTSLVQGRLRAMAVVPYGPAPSHWLPTFLTQATGEAQIDLEVRKTYTFERLLESRPFAATSRLTARSAALVSTQDDGFVFAASLNNVGSALLEWKAGAVSSLMTSGRSHSSTRQPLLDFVAYPRNRRGDMLTLERDAQQTSQVSFGPAQTQLPLLTPGSPLAVAERTYDFSIQRNSLADSGYKVVMASYLDAVTEQWTQGIFRGSGKGLEEYIVDRAAGLPGRENQSFWFDSYGITNDGTVWFVTNDSSNRQTLWRQIPFGPIEKVLGRGDAFQGTVTGIGLPFVASNGEVVAPVYTNQTGCYVRWLPGTPQPQALCGVHTEAVYWNEPGVGALIKTNSGGQGVGVYLWTQNGVTPLVRLNELIEGSPVTEIYSATMNSNGVAFAMVATTANPMLILRLRPDKRVVLREGDELSIQLSPVIAAFVPGRGSGPPLALVGGMTGSVARIDDAAGIQTLIAVGDLLPGGKHFQGSRIDPSGYGQVRSLPDGSILFGDNNGIHRWNNDVIETLYAPGRVSGYQINSPAGFDANSSGQIAAHLHGGADTGIYRLANAGATLVTRQTGTIDGEPVVDFSNPVIDDSGRIAFLFQNDKANWNFLGFWDGSSVRKILWPDMSLPDGRTIRSLDRLKAAADSFTARVTISDGQATLITYRNGAWQYVVGRGEPIATGVTLTWLDFNFESNAAGDVAFSTGQSLETKRGATFHAIHDFNESTEQNEFLISLTNLQLKDNGVLYVLATTDLGQQVVYRATPGVAASTAIEVQPFSLKSRGSASINSAGRSTGLVTGFATIQPDTGKTLPEGLAIFGLRRNGVLVTEAGVPAATLIRSGRFFAEVGGAVNTGLAIANPSNEVAVVQFYLTDETGATIHSGTVTVGAKSQIAEFLDGPTFRSSTFRGTFTFTSSVRIGVTALRGLTNLDGNFLITTLPVADTSIVLEGDQYLPHFAIGNGWTTQLILLNPTDNAIEGSFTFYGEGSDTTPGAPIALSIDQKSATSFDYSIPARSMRRYVPSSLSEAVPSGFVVIRPKSGMTAPSSLAVFSMSNSRTTVSEAGVSGSPVGKAFRMYAEVSGNFMSGERGSLATGIAVANSTSTPAVVSVELIDAEGAATGFKGSLKVPGSGKRAAFLQQIPGLERVPSSFIGTLRLTADVGVTMLGLRGRYNEVSNFLITTTPAILEGVTTTAERVFPHLADGSGYTTQFILIDAGSGSSSGAIRFFNRQGQPLALRFQNQ